MVQYVAILVVGTLVRQVRGRCICISRGRQQASGADVMTQSQLQTRVLDFKAMV